MQFTNEVLVILDNNLLWFSIAYFFLRWQCSKSIGSGSGLHPSRRRSPDPGRTGPQLQPCNQKYCMRLWSYDFSYTLLKFQEKFIRVWGEWFLCWAERDWQSNTIVSTEQTISSIYCPPSIYTTLHRGGIHAQLLILTYHIQGRYSCPSSPPYTEKVFMLILTSHIQRRYSCSSSPPTTETVFMLINYRTFYSDPVMLSPSPKQTKKFHYTQPEIKRKEIINY